MLYVVRAEETNERLGREEREERAAGDWRGWNIHGRVVRDVRDLPSCTQAVQQRVRAAVTCARADVFGDLAAAGALPPLVISCFICPFFLSPISYFTWCASRLHRPSTDTGQYISRGGIRCCYRCGRDRRHHGPRTFVGGEKRKRV